MALLVLDDEELFEKMTRQEIDAALPHEEMIGIGEVFSEEDDDLFACEEITKEYALPPEWGRLVDKMVSDSETKQPISKRAAR